MPVRRLFFSLIFILAAFIFPFNTFAKTPAGSASASPASYTNLPPTIPTTSPIYTDLLVHNLFHTFSCLSVGTSAIGQPCLTYQVTQNAQGTISGVPVLSDVNLSGGALGGTSSLIAALFQNPPVRTADYLASVGEGLGIVKQANAQVVGSGATILSPILRLWQVSRNISYVFIIIIFLVIGLMIMFRSKINPQTVISAQAALPGLVVGLIMITFSYFFAGLISDMAFIGTNLVGYYFSAANGTTPPQNLVSDMSKQNMLGIVSPFTGLINKDDASNMLSSIWDQLGDGATGLLTMLATFLTANLISQSTELLKLIPKYGELVQSAFILVGAGVTWKNPTAIIGMTLSFIATAMLLFAMFKLLMKLLNAYLNIIFLTFSAPFQFLAASLPGRQGIATSWILNMLSHILAFPAVIAVLYFVAFLAGPVFLKANCGIVVSKPPPVAAALIPPERKDCIFKVPEKESLEITNSTAFPLFGGMNLNFLRLLLAFGAIIALPSIPDILGRTIGRASQAGQMIGQEIGGTMGQGRQYAGQFQQGVGQASGQLARTRGLFNTPGYERYITNLKEVKDSGGRVEPTYGIREVYIPGTGYSFGALARNRQIGGFINKAASKVSGGRWKVGGVPPAEKGAVAAKVARTNDESENI